MLEHYRYVLWYTICGLSWGMVALLICSLFRFKQIRKLLIYEKRFPKIVIAECLIALFNCLCIWPLFVSIGFEFEAWQKYQNIVDIFVYTFYPFGGHGIIALEACRLWTMYFKIHHVNALLNDEWKSMIDTNSSHHNWYLNNQNTFGNVKFIATRFAVPYYLFAATTSMSLLTLFTYRDWTQFIDCILYGIPINFILYLFIRLLRDKTLVQDSFLFYYEFKTTNIVFFGTLILYLLNEILFLVAPHIAFAVTGVLGIISLSAVSIVSAWYIPHIILNDKMWANKSEHCVLLKILRIQSESKIVVGSKTKTVRLCDIFANEVYVGSFIRHLIKEFSVECVLSYIEMKQFRYSLHDKLKNDNEAEAGNMSTSDIDIYGVMYQHFGAHIPKSSIIFCNRDKYILDEMTEREEIMHHFKTAFIQLYDKYLSTKSQFEVNISYEMRESYSIIAVEHALDNWNVDGEALVHIFDPVIDEMMLLMNASKSRFVQSEEWIKLYQK